MYNISFEQRLEHTSLKKYDPSYPYEFPYFGGGEKQEGVVLLYRMVWSWHTSEGDTVQSKSSELEGTVYIRRWDPDLVSIGLCYIMKQTQ